jgi:hypothetical protein
MLGTIMRRGRIRDTLGTVPRRCEVAWRRAVMRTPDGAWAVAG